MPTIIHSEDATPFMYEIQRTQIHYIKSFANLRRSRTPVQRPQLPERNWHRGKQMTASRKIKREIGVIFQMSMAKCEKCESLEGYGDGLRR